MECVTGYAQYLWGNSAIFCITLAESLSPTRHHYMSLATLIAESDRFLHVFIDIRRKLI
uniref:Uncharacterized protein n=1 Tax=Oryza brachyantha TaxID=4533 RepID=J3L1N2_ORYBR